MNRKLNTRAGRESNTHTPSAAAWPGHAGLLFILLLGLATLSACGGSSNSSDAARQISGNWQITNMALDPALRGGMQGGFLKQNKGSISGQFVYSFSLISQPGTFCNSGTATITGTVSGQDVTLTAVAGAQTYTLKGTLSSDGSTVMGTYDSTDGQGCGTAQTGLQWSAILVPPLSGAVQGSFHSTGTGTIASLSGQDFFVTGTLLQGPNTGASSASVTGTLDFQDYPCLTSASVNGQISGNSVILQMIATNGLNAGSIGAPSSQTTISPAVFAGSPSGYVLSGTNAYGVSTSNCPGGSVPGDVGNVCLALGYNTGTLNDPTQFTNQACTEPITLTPGSLAFPPQFLETAATSQSITLTNTDPSGGTVSGLRIVFQSISGSEDFGGGSDFSGIANFSEQDTCSDPAGSTFSLGPHQSCTITAIFSPQQSCTWIPTTVPPSQCPPFASRSVPSPPALGARVTVTSPSSSDANTNFRVPVTGIGLSAIQPSTPELDFGSESLNGPGSAPQSVSFTNLSNAPVQILPAVNPAPCGQPDQSIPLPRPLVPGTVPGIKVVTQISADPPTIDYVCDIDPVSGNASFPITSDSCTGALLEPLQSCMVAVKFVPQPATQVLSLSYVFFLQLNTLQCTTTTTSECEIDAGRFPVELWANLPSPLRMSPGADLEFGVQSKGQISQTPLTLTLFNDPTYPNVNSPSPQTVNITGVVINGDYSELDDCLGKNLAPGSSCSLLVYFTPQVIGFDQGKITITYNNGLVQTVFLRGTGQ